MVSDDVDFTGFILANSIASAFEPVNKFLVWSSRSYKNLVTKKQKPLLRAKLLEGVEKTYPTDLFTRALAKDLAKIFDLQEILVGKTLDNEDILHWTRESGFRIVEDTKDKVFKHTTPKLLLEYFEVESRVASSTTCQLVVPSNLMSLDLLSTKFVANLKMVAERALGFGYSYVAHESSLEDSGNTVALTIVFEALFSKRVIDVQDKLYHITPSSNEAKIFKQGLVPKSKTTNGKIQLGHPDRVYLFTRYDMNVFVQFIQMAAKHSKKFNKILGDLAVENKYTILEVDLDKTKSLKLYRDPLFGKLSDGNLAVFTYSNIPPEAISVKTRFKLKGSLEEESISNKMTRWW